MEEIIKLRSRIDTIDEELLELIAQRINLVRVIGEKKKESGIEIIDQEREEAIFKELIVKAQEKGIDPDVIKKIWGILIKISYDIEGEINGNS